MAGSIVATAAGSYFLLQQAPKKSDHGHGHGDEHGEEHKEEGGEEEAPAEEPAEEEPAQDESAEDTKEESSSDEPKKDAAGKVGSEERGTGEQTGDKSRNEGKPEMPETPDKKENEAAEGEEGKDKDEGKVVKGPEDKTGPEGVQQKGATVKADEDTRKLEPSSQGPKKRVDSPYQTDLGAGETTRDEPGSKKDNVSLRSFSASYSLVLTFKACCRQGARQLQPDVRQASRSLYHCIKTFQRHPQQP